MPRRSPARRRAALAALVALAPLAPLGLPGLPAAEPAAATATAATATAAPAAAPASEGCDRPTDQPADTSARYDLTSGGLERSYVLSLPAGYESRSDWPVVVAFHGRGSTGVEVEGYSGLSGLPAVVAYPDGVVGTGDGHRQAWQGAPYEAPGVDDVAFVGDLLDRIQADLCVDPARSYSTGKSNGGGLVALLACRLPDRIAAVAPVAGAFYPGTATGCESAPPVPTLVVHGTGDTTVPYAGDAARGLPGIAEQAAAWAARNGCSRPPRQTRLADDVTRTRWRGCTDGADVDHVAVLDGGHVWPGARVYSGGGHVTRSIRAERLVWQFLSRHSLEVTR